MTEGDNTVSNKEEVITYNKLPTQEYLNKLFKYCPETGKIFWAVRKAICVKIGDEAGCINGSGYWKISVDDAPLLAHRIIWKMLNGFDPNFIDHINGDKLDNRIENLRSVTQRENSMNMRRPDRNTSGAMGVCWHKRTKRWKPQIKVDGKPISLGSFTDKKEAIAARKEAEIKYGFHENHGKIRETR